MLEHLPDLTLSFLNEATQAWVEYEYNRKVHSEIGEAPLTRFLAGPEVNTAQPRQRHAAPRLHPHRSWGPESPRLFQANGSLLMAPPFPPSGPGEPGSPLSQVI